MLNVEIIIGSTRPGQAAGTLPPAAFRLMAAKEGAGR